MRFADGEMLLEDAHDLTEFAVAMRETVPPSRWVEEYAAKAQLQAFAGLM